MAKTFLIDARGPAIVIALLLGVLVTLLAHRALRATAWFVCAGLGALAIAVIVWRSPGVVDWIATLGPTAIAYAVGCAIGWGLEGLTAARLDRTGDAAPRSSYVYPSVEPNPPADPPPPPENAFTLPEHPKGIRVLVEDAEPTPVPTHPVASAPDEMAAAETEAVVSALPPVTPPLVPGAATLPDSVPPPANGDRHPGLRPAGLPHPRGLIADDLKRIRGIGLQSEVRLQSLGIWHFDQIADWTPDNARWVGSFLAFRGRIERENWIAQAKALAGAPPLLEGAAKVKRARPPSKKSEPERGPPT